MQTGYAHALKAGDRTEAEKLLNMGRDISEQNK